MRPYPPDIEREPMNLTLPDGVRHAGPSIPQLPNNMSGTYLHVRKGFPATDGAHDQHAVLGLTGSIGYWMYNIGVANCIEHKGSRDRL